MKHIVYRKQVCKIVDEKDGMYTLVPVSDDSIKMQVPTDSDVLRELMSKEEVEKLLDEMPNIPVISDNEKLIENVYKELMQTGSHEDLVKIIKTTYLRNEKRRIHNKRMSDKDSEYFMRAEQYLYDEIGTVLGLNFDETKEYVFSKMNEKQE